MSFTRNMSKILKIKILLILKNSNNEFKGSIELRNNNMFRMFKFLGN